MEPLRVAFDVGPLYGPRTGIGNAVAALQAALAERADVVCHPYLASFRTRPPEGTTRLPVPAALAHRLWARSDWPRADRWLGTAAVVHGTNYVVPPTRHAAVVSVYDCWALRHPELVPAGVRRFAPILRRAVRRGAVVHAPSRSTADAVADLLPGTTVRVVPLAPLPMGPSPDEPPLAELAGVPFVLSIGTLERRKNLPRLVEAFAALAATGPDVRLVLAGADGDDRAAVDAAIDRAGREVARRVSLTGRVDDAARSWLVHHAAVVCYPSLDEGFGFPLLDAMQAGVPVVASDAGSVPEVTSGAALLVPALDVDALAGALGSALTDAAVRERLVETGHRRVNGWTWAACAEGMAALYREAVGEAA